jgi:hypothetical protein
MLARLSLLLVAVPALALAADGGAAKTGRAAQPPVQQTATTPTISPPKITLPAPTAIPADPSECRMTCAQTYYYCRAGDRPDDCAGTWGQCVATCNSPDLAPGFSTAP